MSARKTLCVIALLAMPGCGGAGAGQTSTASDEPVQFEDERAAAAAPPASEQVTRGEALLAEGDAQGAEAALRAAIAENAGDPRAHLDLGLALEMQERWSDAEGAYRASIEADPEFAEALNNLGALLRDQDRAEEAVIILRRAVEARPGFGSAYLNLGLALEEQGDAEGAMAAYRRVIELAPREPTARIQLGMLQLAAGDQEHALITLRRAAGPAAGSRAMLSALGNGLRRAGDPQMAVRVLRDAIAAEESEPPAAIVAELALAQFAADERAEAETTLRELIAAQPRYATAHFVLANMLAARRAFADAGREYQAYLRIDPQGEHAEEARGRLAFVRRQR
ncbi:MAG: tetratricopeptide repeat protein [Sandaracinaceae bacterium]